MRPADDHEQWLDFIQKANQGYQYSITNSNYICSNHFNLVVSTIMEILFSTLRTVNSADHPLFSEHTYKLIRSIAELYIKIRLHYIAKEATFQISPETNRNSNTKAIHFSGN